MKPVRQVVVIGGLRMNHDEPILVVEDDQALNQLVCRFLQENGYLTRSVSNGLEAVESIISKPPRMVILDLMLPGMDGLQVCRQVRSRYSGPIIMMTAMGDDIDHVVGLETGADDYLTKPVNPRVLLAHVRAQLRRVDSEPVSTHQRAIIAQNLKIDPLRRSVSIEGKEIPLTTAEFDLLLLLANRVGEPISREALHMETFQIKHDGFDRSIDLRISRLRKKLGDDPKFPTLVKTVRNFGYMLCP